VQILKMEGDTRRVVAFHPEMDPRGLGYAAIVTSDMFGIASSLDGPTHLLLEKQRAFGAKEHLSRAELEELDEINIELDRLGFRFFHPDAEYSRYLRLRNDALAACFKESSPTLIAEKSVTMTRKERDDLATRLIGELVDEEETGKDLP